MNLLNQIKRFKQFTLNVLGNCLESPVIVLLYHRVCEIKDDYQKLAVSPENFAKQIEFLSRNYPVLRFEDDWNKVKKTSFVITFDDGYGDNLYCALPILRKYRIPAAFFITSGNIRPGEEFWWDKLEQILLNTKVALDKLDIPISSGALADIVVKTQLSLKNLSPAARRKFIRKLAEKAYVKITTREDCRPLNTDELRQFDADDLVTIGSHTVNHPQLSALAREEQEYEIKTGKKELEEILGHPVNTFSYPFGNTDDFSGISAEICREAGICKAAANFPGQAHSWTDRFQIPRCLIRNWHIDEFKRQMFRFKYL